MATTDFTAADVFAGNPWKVPTTKVHQAEAPNEVHVEVIETPVRESAVPWDARRATQAIQATMERVAGWFPADYDFEEDQARWDRLECAIDRACRLQNWDALQVALEKFERTTQEMFAEHHKSLLPPKTKQLEFWFESLPEPAGN